MLSSSEENEAFTEMLVIIFDVTRRIKMGESASWLQVAQTVHGQFAADFEPTLLQPAIRYGLGVLSPAAGHECHAAISPARQQDVVRNVLSGRKGEAYLKQVTGLL